jgi:hypothetical protein
MAPNLEEVAQCRQMAAEYKKKAEQELRPLQRDFYSNLHWQWVRLAIAIEAQVAV